LNKATFSIDIVSSMILVRKSGYWDIVTDIAYITDLAQAFTRFKSRQFVVIVDMRGWICSDEVKASEFKTDIVLDRRAQVAECWIVDETKYSDHLLKFVTLPSLDFLRSQSLEEANEWIARQTLTALEKDQLSKWLLAD